jgi:type VI secretion system secreted protein VgrG
MGQAYLQADRPLTVSTPLGPDDLLLVGFHGREAISQLFGFELDLLAENSTDIPFDKLLGKKVTVHLSLFDGGNRPFSGICQEISEGARDETFTAYRMQVVPEIWLLSKNTQCRIYQQVSVPEILKDVFTGLDVDFQLDGTYLARDFCVQYRESDLDFASRLMEEEGIYYFFRHAANGHSLVLADTPRGHPDLPGGATVQFGGSDHGLRGEGRVRSWEKTQELRSGRVSLSDYCFQIPRQTFEADVRSTGLVAVGQVRHTLRVGRNEQFVRDDHPGGYAHRFDGVNPGGGDRSADLDHLFIDNKRTAAIRMEEEAAAGLTTRGESMCRGLASGHRFNLNGHFNADGPYVLTAVEHRARVVNAYRSTNGDGGFVYENTFTCLPLGLPFRPSRTTPRPLVQGTQTAVVVGPPGEEIFTDQYGRIKVHFHWDRHGKNGAASSCWVRVGTPWAGRNWGMIHIPRVGQEVIVDFLDGNPDRPIVVGSVYNADTMPPYDLPRHKTQSGIRSRSTPAGRPSEANEFRFEDQKGQEQIHLQAERNLDTLVKRDETRAVGVDRQTSVGRDETTSVGRDATVTVTRDRKEKVGGDETLNVGKSIAITAQDSVRITCGASALTMTRAGEVTIKGTKIALETGQSKIVLDASGVTVNGLNIRAEGRVTTELKGMITKITADSILQTKAGITLMS